VLIIVSVSIFCYFSVGVYNHNRLKSEISGVNDGSISIEQSSIYNTYLKVTEKRTQEVLDSSIKFLEAESSSLFNKESKKYVKNNYNKIEYSKDFKTEKIKNVTNLEQNKVFTVKSITANRIDKENNYKVIAVVEELIENKNGKSRFIFTCTMVLDSKNKFSNFEKIFHEQ